MNIVMFSPVVKNSAIGRMAHLLTFELLKLHHNIVIVRTENESLFSKETHDYTGIEMISWADDSLVNNVTKDADLIIYQVGNDYGFHQGCIAWLPKLPGVVCLHDFFLGHLFWVWAGQDREEANNILRRFYDEQSAQGYFCHNSSESFIDKTKDTAPMTEWISAMALGVITHSSWGINRVINSCPGPVYVCPLAYDAPALSLRMRNEGEFNVLTIGHINENKRVANVIAAIGSSRKLRSKAVYHLAGHILPSVAEELSSLAKEQGVKLVISGEVDDKTLAEAISEADIISCLRWPSLEAASATAITSMLCGKATIVTDTGFYSEIPDQYVKKINPLDEIESLRSTLELLCQNIELRESLGKDAKAWAEQTFTAKNYAENLIKMAHSVNKAKPILSAVNYFTNMLEGWGASPQLMNFEETIAPLRIFEQNDI